MESLLHSANAAACALIACALVAAVLSPRVRDGVVAKLGMIVMAFGFAALGLLLSDGLDAADYTGVERALGLVHAGLLLAAVGFGRRCWAAVTGPCERRPPKTP